MSFSKFCIGDILSLRIGTYIFSGDDFSISFNNKEYYKIVGLCMNSKKEESWIIADTNDTFKVYIPIKSVEDWFELKSYRITLCTDIKSERIKEQHTCSTCIYGDWQVNGAETNPDLAPLFHSECKECSPVEDHWKPKEEKK